MSLSEILASIDWAPLDIRVLSDADLNQWAIDALGILNSSPEGKTPDEIVEYAGRACADKLLSLCGPETLTPSSYRLCKAMADLLPADLHGHVAPWCDLILHYFSEARSAS